MGINVRGLQLLVWGATGALSGLFISIVGNTQAASATSMIVLLIPAAAAALVGAFSNLTLTIAGGLLVGALQGLLTSFPADHAASRLGAADRHRPLPALEPAQGGVGCRALSCTPPRRPPSGPARSACR